jgi:hypothetical protein
MSAENENTAKLAEVAATELFSEFFGSEAGRPITIGHARIKSAMM